jgi:hypothetical protein
MNDPQGGGDSLSEIIYIKTWRHNPEDHNQNVALNTK